MNHWTSTKKLFMKREVYSDAFRLFPAANKAVMMPSTSCTDIECLHAMGKMGDSSEVYVFDNLESKDLSGTLRDRVMEFKRLYRERTHDIFGSDAFFKSNEHRMRFCNIFDMPLTHPSVGGHLDVVYADSCNVYGDRIEQWVSRKWTVDAVRVGGVLAFTVLVNRTNSIGESKPSGCEFRMMGIYDGNELSYKRKLSFIANRVAGLSEGKLRPLAMYHYSESNRKSQMALCVFERR